MSLIKEWFEARIKEDQAMRMEASYRSERTASRIQGDTIEAKIANNMDGDSLGKVYLFSWEGNTAAGLVRPNGEGVTISIFRDVDFEGLD